MINKVKQFLTEVIQELKKVTWPGRKEAISSTVVVLIFIMLMSILVIIADEIFGKVIKLLIG